MLYRLLVRCPLNTAIFTSLWTKDPGTACHWQDDPPTISLPKSLADLKLWVQKTAVLTI